ncbi:MAG: hypothetical protein ABIB47_01500 [Candidatus Woesearchaeota archaeon]
MIPDEILNPVIEDIAGEDVIPLVQLIKGKINVSEFRMAEKLDITINRVRNMVYRLSSYDLVDSSRKKDKKKGWYVYSWTLNMPKLRDLSVKLKLDNIERLEQRLRTEKANDFFRCPDKHIRASYTLAMEHNFKCPECGLNLEKEDNTKLIETINKTLLKLKQEVEFLRELKIKPMPEKKPVKQIIKKKIRKKKATLEKPTKKKKIKRKPPKKKSFKKVKKPKNKFKPKFSKTKLKRSSKIKRFFSRKKRR